MQRQLYDSVNVCVSQDESFDLEYYVLKNDYEYEGTQIPGYGIEVHKKFFENGVEISETSRVENIYMSQRRIGEIIGALLENRVTPVTLRDVIYDLICQ